MPAAEQPRHHRLGDARRQAGGDGRVGSSAAVLEDLDARVDGRRMTGGNARSHPPLPYSPSAASVVRAASARRTGTAETSTEGVTWLSPRKRSRRLIEKFGAGASDTGSTRVQVAMLTERINQLTEHLRTHSHDHHSRRGLLKLVGRSRRFLNYMQRTDLEGYRALIKELGLRR